MIGDNVTKGYDLFGDHGRNLPTPHGSGKEPMYGSMGKSCKPDPNRRENILTYTLSSVLTHITPVIFI